MFKEIKKFTLQIVAGANVASLLTMLLVGYSDCLNPVDYPILANAGLSFPLLLFVNVCFLVFWVLFKWKGVLLSLVGFIVCYSPIRTYFPLNMSSDAPSGSIKVVSYNIFQYSGWEGKKQEHPILLYLQRQNADIVCLQEASPDLVGDANIEAVLGKTYAYRDTARVGSSDVLALYSKHPILSHEHINYESRYNLSVAFRVKVGTDTVLVINNHFESTGLSNSDRTQFKEMVKGDMQRDSVKQTSRRLVDKLGEASARRAPQVETVARYIKQHSDESIILCGDFNDCPISYTHHLLSDLLTDCYVATANGPGISYHKGGFYVRIDNIMCSSDWKPYECKVDNKIKTSDHYPIICRLKKHGKH